jgi:tripartite-type tricarboxylate transporter receptor subunit TctC
VDALLKLVRAQPGRLNFASAGTGTLAHLNVELLKARTGIRVAHVPYKGSNPALIGLLAGEVDAVFDTPAAVLPHLRSGRLRALAVSTATRTPSAREIPTLIETGVADFDVSVWFGLLAPAGTPADVIRTVHADTLKVLAAPDVVERIGALGQDILTQRPDEFGATIRKEVAKWGELVKQAGIRFE